MGISQGKNTWNIKTKILSLPKVKIPTNDPEENDLDEISDEKFKKNVINMVNQLKKISSIFKKDVNRHQNEIRM